MTIQSFRRFLLSGLIALLPAVGAHAADFPARPITIVVPYAAGGAGDVLARLFAEKLKSRTGQPVPVDNKPGAGTYLAKGHQGWQHHASIAKSASKGPLKLASRASHLAALTVPPHPLNAANAHRKPACHASS